MEDFFHHERAWRLKAWSLFKWISFRLVFWVEKVEHSAFCSDRGACLLLTSLSVMSDSSVRNQRRKKLFHKAP